MNDQIIRLATADTKRTITVIKIIKISSFRDLSKISLKMYGIFPDYSTIGTSLAFYINNKSFPSLTQSQTISIPLELSSGEILVAAKIRSIDAERLNLPWLNPIIVETLEGVFIDNFTLSENKQVYNIKLQIFRMHRIKCSFQELTYRGRSLKDAEFLADLYMEDGNFTSSITLALSFKGNENYEIQRFFFQYEKSQGSQELIITLETLTEKILIHGIKERISTVRSLKDYIKKSRKVPIEQQTLFYQDTVLGNEYEFVGARSLLENHSNQMNSITITLLVKPSSFDANIESDYFKLPNNGIMNLSTMTTVAELKLKLQETLDIRSQYLALIPRNVSSSFVEFDDKALLHEIYFNKYYATNIKVARKLYVEVNGQENGFFLFVHKPLQTLMDIIKYLEKVLGFKKAGCMLVLDDNLDPDTTLSDVPMDEVIRLKENKRCVLS